MLTPSLSFFSWAAGIGIAAFVLLLVVDVVVFGTVTV
jgi:hypothetical protein